MFKGLKEDCHDWSMVNKEENMVRKNWRGKSKRRWDII